MNTVGIDTLLKNTQAGPKAKPSASSEDGGAFKDYLREAANTQKRPVKEQPVAKAKPADTPIQSPNGEQDSAKSSDEQTKTAVESAEQIEENITETEADEVLLSAAAITASAETAMVIESPEIAVETMIETVSVETTQLQQGQEIATGQDFLPELEHALVTNTDAEGETAASTDTGVTGEAAANSDAVINVVDQAIAQAPGVGQVAAEQSSELKATTDRAAETDGEGEKPDTADQKVAKPAANGQHAVAEQLIAQVATTLTSSESTQETKHQAPAEAGSLAPLASQSQQQSQTGDTTRADTQPLNSDHDSRMPTIDRARFVQRVANAFRSAQQNEGHIQLRLSPPELGSLRIEIAVRHGVLSANLETETADARRVLLDNLPALRQRLAEQDIRIEKFDVDVRRDGGHSDGQAGAQDRQAQQQSQRATAQNRLRTTTPTEVASIRIAQPISTSADVNLDVRI
jgi:flagellar hook-length control protein FliK